MIFCLAIGIPFPSTQSIPVARMMWVGDWNSKSVSRQIFHTNRLDGYNMAVKFSKNPINYELTSTNLNQRIRVEIYIESAYGAADHALLTTWEKPVNSSKKANFDIGPLLDEALAKEGNEEVFSYSNNERNDLAFHREFYIKWAEIEPDGTVGAFTQQIGRAHV